MHLGPATLGIALRSALLAASHIMDEDLDQTVERCAVLLLSEDSAEVADGFRAVEAASVAEGSGEWGFVRVLQELAAYKRGIVVERLVADREAFAKAGVLARNAVFTFITCYLPFALVSCRNVVVSAMFWLVGCKKNEVRVNCLRDCRTIS